MRPKIVILTLVAAFGILGLIAILKGVTGKNTSSDDSGTAQATTPPPTGTTDTNSRVLAATGSNGTVVVSDELRAALIANEIDKIQELQGDADGTNNPTIIAALLDKLSQPEEEVRKAALDALKQLNDTNAVPGLEKMAESVKDPREKVAILDAIDYIKMPSATDNVPPEYATNFTRNASTSTNVSYNPAFVKGGKKPRTRINHQNPASGAGMDQPQPQ